MSDERLLTLPSPRETPPDVLRILREVEPAVELYYRPTDLSGRGAWQVLLMDYKPGRIREADRMVVSAGLRGGTSLSIWRRIRLMQEGASLLGEYREADIESPSWLKDNLQYLLGRSEQDIERDVALGLATAEGIPREVRRTAILHDFTHHEGPSIHNIALRGKRSFTSRAAERISSAVRRFTVTDRRKAVAHG